MAEPSALRDRLLALRADALQQLASADHPGAGPLVTLTDAETALAASAPDLEPAARAIVSDDANRQQHRADDRNRQIAHRRLPFSGAAAAMAAGVSDRLWSMDDMALIDGAEGEPKKRGSYKPVSRKGPNLPFGPIVKAIADS